MPNYTAEVTTDWLEPDGNDNSIRPSLPINHAVISCYDTTGQPVKNLIVDPNIYIVQIVCSEAVLAAIENDLDYTVLWSEEIEDVL